MVTTDKVYLNNESIYGYKETDRLGGDDPYSASKAATEIAIASWRSSFCGNLLSKAKSNIATARAEMSLEEAIGQKTDFPRLYEVNIKEKVIKIRNPLSRRPWQHVLEPLSGYLHLAQTLHNSKLPPCEAFNFGPYLESNKTVQDLVENILMNWQGSWESDYQENQFHEACLLHLQIDKSYHILGWKPKFDFDETVKLSVQWYKSVFQGQSPLESCLGDINYYQSKNE